jgi:hypothetical protein
MVGAECGVIAKLMPFGLAAITPEVLHSILRSQQAVDDVLERVKKLQELWRLLCNLTVLVESPEFTEANLERLDDHAIRLNIWWRDTFGTLGCLFGQSNTPSGNAACTYKIHKL